MRKDFLKRTNLPSCKIEELTITPDTEKPTTKVDYKVDVLRYASKAGKRIFVPINTVHPFTDIPPKMENRIQPIRIRENTLEEDIFVLKLPEGYQIESIPQEKVNMAPKMGSYSVEIIKSKTEITYKRRLLIKAIDLPAADYEAFRNFYKEIAKADQMKLVLVEQKT